MRDENHEEIRWLSSSLIKKNPKVFEPLLFCTISVEDLSRIARSRELGQKLWTYSVVHRCLSDQFVPTQRHGKNDSILNRL